MTQPFDLFRVTSSSHGRVPESARRVMWAVAGGLIACATSCSMPVHRAYAEPRDGLPINDPANVLCSVYVPESKKEAALEDEIEAKVQAFEGEAKEVGVGQESAVTESFARSGGIPAADWWAGEGFRPLLGGGRKTASVTLDQTYQSALAHSSQVRVFASLPLIRETAVGEAEGTFDPELFSNWRYDSTSEPTGSSLETGLPNDYFREGGWVFEGGVRKRMVTGATVGLTQEIGERSNNSKYFIPRDQGRASLTLSVMQPLLRGAGVRYNRSLIQIAELDAETGYDEFIRQLETHLMEVNRTYWTLYLARTVYVEKQRLAADTGKVVAELEERGNLDAMESQLSRARAALASRKSDLVRSELAIRNAESRLRALLNDPRFIEQGIGEIIPGDLPVAFPLSSDFSRSVSDSLAYRPEIKQAERHLKAASLREGMARNEKLPMINAVGELGVSGLQGEADIGGAYSDQYDDTEPTWGVGVVATMPLERRAAKAIHLRTELEFRQKVDQLRSTLDTVLLEVQIAHREVTTAWPDAKAKWDAARAADQELEVLWNRRGVDADAGATSTSLYLEKLLDAQERSSLAREEFLRALVVYNSALTNLERAKGTLLQYENVGVLLGEDEKGLPLITLEKDAAAKRVLACYELQK